MRIKIKYIAGFFTMLLLMTAQAVQAADGPVESPFNNPLAVTLIVLMLLLLIIIGVLANILLGTADLKIKKNKKVTGGKSAAVITTLLFFLLLTTTSVIAQNTETGETTQKIAKTIGGMSASTFYIMAAVIFLELFIIIALLINIKFLLKVEKEKVAGEVETAKARKTQLSWWDRFNKLKPVSQEAELDLGHEYDGIRELNNRLPPWWLYGFYATILFAGIYLWRFHVSHNGPSSKEEYEKSVAKAEVRIQEYLKKKGEAVDENTVALLTSEEDLSAGKVIFIKSCATCHKETGAGDVGPNLTDDYWLHGNDIKSVFKIIRYGVNAMPQWQNQYSNKQIAQVASYLKSLHGSNPPNPKKAEGTLQKEEVTPQPVSDSALKEGKIVMN